MLDYEQDVKEFIAFSELIGVAIQSRLEQTNSTFGLADGVVHELGDGRDAGVARNRPRAWSYHSMMTKTISATEARTQLGGIMQEVCEKGEPVIVQKSGKDQVAIIPCEMLADLQDAQTRSKRQDAMRRATALSKQIRDRHAREGREMKGAAEIINEMREERSERMLRCIRGGDHVSELANSNPE